MPRGTQAGDPGIVGRPLAAAVIGTRPAAGSPRDGCVRRIRAIRSPGSGTASATLAAATSPPQMAKD
jgi:hypothetical protein